MRSRRRRKTPTTYGRPLISPPSRLLVSGGYPACCSGCAVAVGVGAMATSPTNGLLSPCTAIAKPPPVSPPTTTAKPATHLLPMIVWTSRPFATFPRFTGGLSGHRERVNADVPGDCD
jgi:hypothetical protein